jgi:Bacterial Ig-like domain/Bacterial Ig domain
MRRTLLLLSTMALTLLLAAGVALASYVNESEPNDTLATAQNIDNFSLDNDPNISNSTTIPHASVQGTGNDTFDFYKFTVPPSCAGTAGVMDIDGAWPQFDSYLRLYDSDLINVASNDDLSPPDPGSIAVGQFSTTTLDSYLEYNFPSAGGTYYLKVNESLLQSPPGTIPEDRPVPNGVTYQLHISLPNHPTSPTPLTDTVAPTVCLTAPQDGATVSGSNVTLSANAFDNPPGGVKKVEFLVDGVVVGEDTSAESGNSYSVNWDSSTADDGPVSIQAKAYDTSDQSEVSASRTVTVDNTKPTVSLTAPQDGASVSGSEVTLSADATDTVGVKKVEFLVDGVVVGTDDSAESGNSYSVNWDSSTADDGPVSIQARAYDTADQSEVSTSRTVTVDNTKPTVVSVTPTDRATKVSFTAPDITATFSEKMAFTDGQSSTSFTLEKVRVKGRNVTSISTVPTSVENPASGQTNENKVRLKPDADLEKGTNYRVSITTSATDLVGNPLGTAKTWRFKTAPK